MSFLLLLPTPLLLEFAGVTTLFSIALFVLHHNGLVGLVDAQTPFPRLQGGQVRRVKARTAQNLHEYLHVLQKVASASCRQVVELSCHLADVAHQSCTILLHFSSCRTIVRAAALTASLTCQFN
jgi:hypothetical protein